ncbi:T9SS type A sorting domain-containing protein [Gramella sp. BOM4]|nr:T9SS type A sorting domain-containing protein [Christiangramia bathymodioli]
MKKSIKTLVACFSLLFIFSAKASDELSLTISEKENLIVEMKKTERDAVLSLLNENGEIIYKDRIFGDSNYTKKLGFEKLPVGVYKLILDKRFGITNSVIKKTADGLVLGEESFVFKPNYKQEGKRVKVYLANPGRAPLRVQVFDSNGEEVGNFSNSDEILKKTLDFSRVRKGAYMLKIQTPSNIFTEHIEI